MKTKPLSPAEVETLGPDIPDVVIAVVNELLRRKYRSKGATIILQSEILNEIRKRESKIDIKNLLEQNGLDFEPLFQKEGWVVIYDKPGYGEDYEPRFSFNKK